MRRETSVWEDECVEREDTVASSGSSIGWGVMEEVKLTKVKF